jgi:hypothetical protein
MTGLLSFAPAFVPDICSVLPIPTEAGLGGEQLVTLSKEACNQT